MKRLDRLTAILIQLQSKKIVKAQMLADKFEVSLRTIYRDMLSLQEAGVPIGSQEGVGYFLVEGYHLPPVMFSEEEANSLLIGAKFISNLTDKVVAEAFQNALDKIKAVLPSERKEVLNVLDERLLVSKRLGVESENPVISEIQKAIGKNLCCEIKYYSNYNGQVSEREIEPLGIVFYADAWHLMAWCRMRKAYRDFRTDRIGKIRITGNGYDRNAHPGLQEHMQQLTDQYQLTEIKVRFKKEILRFTSNDKYNHGYVDEKDLGDQVEMKFLSPSMDYTARWLLMFDNAVEILSPHALLEHISDLVGVLQKKYLK
ncbi:YafY family transcriptional regulator [Hyphobacterium sp. CCMP332]|nr:YafY family transcriptional regulator [Hyphobacterium sp. CCMP332]